MEIDVVDLEAIIDQVSFFEKNFSAEIFFFSDTGERIANNVLGALFGKK